MILKLVFEGTFQFLTVLNMSSTDISSIIFSIDNFGSCSQENYQSYLKALMTQNNFEKQMEQASIYVDTLSVEFEECKAFIFSHSDNTEKIIADVRVPDFFSVPGWDFKV